MDQYVTTYRRDYLWPYIRAVGIKSVPEKTCPRLSTMPHGDTCVCMPVFQTPEPDKQLTSATVHEGVWTRRSPAAPLLDPKLYPVRVGRPPEVSTMRLDQPNVFLKKLQDKYPFMYEVLLTSPPDEMISRIDKNRLRTTYQVDFDHMNEYPSVPYDELLRAAGVQGMAPCAKPVRLPGDPCRPNQRPVAFRIATITKEGRAVGGEGGGGIRGGKNGGGKDTCPVHLVRITPDISEYQDAVSKLGELIIKDKIHVRGNRLRSMRS